MNAIVKSITPGSPAASTIIAPGDILRKINGESINDVLDYEFYSYDSELMLELACPNGRDTQSIKLIKLRKPEGADLGIEFETYLMDKERSCANKCIFCFIDQLPEGMRESLYYKDDDVRLSFLQGNYISLTNLFRRDVERIIKLRISPINVSVHTLDRRLRSYMLGTAKAGRSVDTIRALAKAGITLNCQIVCCPGVNDGQELSKTIEEFIKLGSCINSVSIVPVGLTKHRQGLTAIHPYNKELALQTVRQVEHYGNRCLRKRGSRVFFCADELYMLAGLELPDNGFYEDYPQLENGVGMMRLFITEFEEALQKEKGIAVLNSIQYRNDESYEAHNNVFKSTSSVPVKSSLVTGVLAHNYLTNLLITAAEKYDTIVCNAYAIKNDFFGESITVSGLVTGSDIIAQLKGKDLGTRLLIPQNMLRNVGVSRDTGATSNTAKDGVFLDDVTVEDVSNALGIPVRIIKQNGADLLDALLDITS